MNTPLNFRASLWRHGRSVYRQGNGPQPFETADDLAPDGIETVTTKATALAQLLKGYSLSVNIYSSPTGRTLHTARIIGEVLSANGVCIRGLNPEEALTEVENFEWTKFEPLMEGGDIHFDGHVVTIDGDLTNPTHLPYPDYFMADAIHQLPAAVTDHWPDGLLAHIRSFERFENVSQRSIEFMSRTIVGHMHCPRNYHDVFVTHDAAAMYLLDTATKGAQKSLHPGTCMLLGTYFDQLKVVQVDDRPIVEEE